MEVIKAAAGGSRTHVDLGRAAGDLAVGGGVEWPSRASGSARAAFVTVWSWSLSRMNARRAS
ncbi:hypothetical protein ACWEQC_02435 [Streptomyces shenzhenensis]